MGKKNRNRIIGAEAVQVDETPEVVEAPVEEKETKRIFKAKIVGDYDLVNVRHTPNGEIAGQVSRGNELIVVDTEPKVDGNGSKWYHVVASIGLEGWIMAKLIDIFEEAEVKAV